MRPGASCEDGFTPTKHTHATPSLSKQQRRASQRHKAGTEHTTTTAKGRGEKSADALTSLNGLCSPLERRAPARKGQGGDEAREPARLTGLEASDPPERRG